MLKARRAALKSLWRVKYNMQRSATWITNGQKGDQQGGDSDALRAAPSVPMYIDTDVDKVENDGGAY